MKYTKEILEPIVQKNISVRGVVRDLGLSVQAGGNASHISKLIKKFGINTSHFKGKSHGTSIRKKVPLEDVLIQNSSYSRHALKKRLLNKGLLEDKCQICGQEPFWNGKPMVLVLDHINGINNDNRLENLRMLCPNCNSQEPTFCNKGKRKYYYCKCGAPISKNASKCHKCENSSRDNRKIKNRPCSEQLQKDVNELGYRGTGRKYNVSDNCIRKWI